MSASAKGRVHLSRWQGEKGKTRKAARSTWWRKRIPGDAVIPPRERISRLLVPSFEHVALEHHVQRASAAVAGQAGGETEHLGVLAQPGGGVTLDQLGRCCDPRRRALGHSDGP